MKRDCNAIVGACLPVREDSVAVCACACTQLLQYSGRLKLLLFKIGSQDAQEDARRAGHHVGRCAGVLH